MNSRIFSLIFTIFFSVFLLFAINFIYDYLYPVRYENQIEKYCEMFKIEKELAFAIVNAESSFNVNAISKAGAQGLMQLLPNTAEYIARKINYNKEIDLFNIDCNLNLGIAYLSYLKNIFYNIDQVICAYNAGEGIVRDWINQSGNGEMEIHFEETKDYLNKVKNGIRIYTKKLS